MPQGLNSISGMFSGLDTANLVDSIIQFERRPAFLLEARKAREELRLAAYDALEGVMANLKAQLDILRKPGDFQMRQATVSNPDLLSMTLEDQAAIGNTTLRIQQLAQSHQMISQSYADSESALGAGDVSISLAGEEVLNLTLVEGADSLQDLAQAINESDSGISASIIDTGNGDTPYRLIINGGSTGADQVLSVTSDLSGGAGLDLGGIGSVVYQGSPPSAEVTSGGGYQGGEAAVYSFTVTGGGIVGADDITIAWTNDLGDSGEILLDRDYVPGTSVAVHAGLTLSFSDAQLQTDSAWTVDALPNTLQSAQDAIVSMGDGGAPLEIHSSTNSISDLLPGVTLDLLGADPDQDITIQVKQDVDGIVDRLRGFVDEYNSVIGFLDSQMSYDSSSESAGVLMGDRVVLRMDSQIREDLVRAVQGVTGDLSLLTQIGIGMSVDGSLNTDGTLSLDETALRDALNEDFAGVVALLGSTGQADDADIVFLNAGSDVKPNGAGSGYDLHVTQAATRGSFVGASMATPSAFDPLVIDASNKLLKVSINGVTSATLTLEEGAVDSGSELASRIQAAINGDEDLGDRDVLVDWVDDGGGNGHLVITSKTYGSTSKVVLEDVDTSIYAAAGLAGGLAADGQDVAGYFMVDGVQEEASGSGRILTGNMEGGATQSLSVEVRLSEEALIEQGEAQGMVSIYSGVADRMHRSLDNYLDTVDGIVARRQEGLRGQIQDYSEQVDEVDARLEMRRDRYMREFMRMETLMAQMNGNSNAFMSMMSSTSFSTPTQNS